MAESSRRVGGGGDGSGGTGIFRQQPRCEVSWPYAAQVRGLGGEGGKVGGGAAVLRLPFLPFALKVLCFASRNRWYKHRYAFICI